MLFGCIELEDFVAVQTSCFLRLLSEKLMKDVGV